MLPSLDELIVTTSRRPSPLETARARKLALELNVPYAKRKGIPVLLDAHQKSWAYIVSRRRDEVVPREGIGFHIHPGLFFAKAAAGEKGPLVQALAGDDGLDAINEIVDCTLGLAQDALVTSHVFNAQVLGIEGSPIVQCLLEEGLARLQKEVDRPWADAASRIRLVKGKAPDILATLPENSADVVSLDPMMVIPGSAQPGFSFFRNFAVHDQPFDDWLLEAARVARRRVVWKISSVRKTPVSALKWHRRIESKACGYLVHDVNANDSQLKSKQNPKNQNAKFEEPSCQPKVEHKL
ncbi:MAG: class I SAM-dependent methyltransferase [Deltaproteobacteria bacterium]|nr:class I SAM-dependent methyltransferase [Deltaproteobacteria bacterium]